MKDLTNGNEAKLIILFALPMLLGNIFQQMYSMVDSIVVGQFVGSGALAAVGASFPIIFLLISLVMGITMGMSIIISQYYGAKNMDKVKAAVDTSFIFVFIASIVLTFVGIFLSRPLLMLLRTPSDILDQADLYLKIFFSGIIGVMGYNMVSAILRALGDSKTPLYAIIAATVINIVLDLLFVIVFHWDVAGVAWATVISQGVSFVGLFIYLNKTHAVLKIKLSDIHFDRELFKQSLKLGLPNGIQQMLVAAGMMVVSSIVNGFGTVTVAGFTAASKLDAFAAMPAMNISQALSTFTGQNIGAGKIERVKGGFRAGFLMSLAISLTIGFIVIVFGRPLLMIFTNDLPVIDVGVRYLVIVGASYALFSTMFVTNGVLRGAGSAFIPMINTILALWVIRVPVALSLAPILGSDGIWWSLPAGWAMGTVFSVSYYFSGRWKNKSVVNRAPIIIEE